MRKEGAGPGYHIPWECLFIELPQQCNVVNGIIGILDAKGNSHTPASCLQSYNGIWYKALEGELGRSGLAKALLAIARRLWVSKTWLIRSFIRRFITLLRTFNRRIGL